MAETRGDETARRMARLAAGRLWANRWLLAAAIAAVLALHWLAGGTPAVAMLAILALVAVAASLPVDSNGGRGAQGLAAERGGLEGLSPQDLAAAVADPLIIFDASGSVVHANEAARLAFGALGAGISLLLKFRAPEMQAAIESVRSGSVSTAIVDFSERVPIERVYKVTASATGGGADLFVLLFKDQSEARRIDRMRADFIANASHELRTPLASISGFVETLRGPAKNDPAAREQFLSIMQSQTARMARLIDDLLSLSRLEMKPYLVPGERVELRAILRGVVDSLNPLVRDSGVVVEQHLGDEPISVRGDRDELIQVFENLLENACKYGQSGGRVVLSLEQSTVSGQPEIMVTIRDFGPGIAAEHIPRLTERFYRVDVETSRSQKGTGLGLAIVKHILTRHNGRLGIKSDPAEGTAFTVHLPAG